MSKKEIPAVKASDTKEQKPETPPTRAPKKSEMQLRVKFTEAEIISLARKLAEKNAEAEQAELDKKAVTKQLASKCDAIAAQVGELSGKINAGFEYRNVQVEVTYDDPKVGLKTTRRLDTLEIVDTEPMSLAERQIDLPGMDTQPGNSGGLTTPLGQMIDIATGKAAKRPPLRDVTGSGVVVTDEDGEGEDLHDDDEGKT